MVKFLNFSLMSCCTNIALAGNQCGFPKQDGAEGFALDTGHTVGILTCEIDSWHSRKKSRQAPWFSTVLFPIRVYAKRAKNFRCCDSYGCAGGCGSKVSPKDA